MTLFLSLFCGGSAACSGKSCNQVGCTSGVRLSATLAGRAPWRVSFCRGANCTACDVDSHPEGGSGATACTDVQWIQNTGEASPTLLVETFDKTSFPEGMGVSFTAQDTDQMKAPQWSSTVHYEPHEVDEGPGCEPARCSSFSATVTLR